MEIPMGKDFFAEVRPDKNNESAARLVYIKPVDIEEAIALRAVVPSDITLMPGTKLYALYAADGTPIGITDNWAAAYSAAVENKFQLLSVH
jgi:hypothetical protein